jgi:hypothetical protein
MALLTLTLFLVWLPSDINAIRDGLESNPRLAVGISLKLLMHTVAVVGLWLDRTMGYAFLLGASVQGLLVAVGTLRAVPMSRWSEFTSVLWWPALDATLRVASLVFIFTRPARLVGGEAKP